MGTVMNFQTINFKFNRKLSQKKLEDIFDELSDSLNIMNILNPIYLLLNLKLAANTGKTICQTVKMPENFITLNHPITIISKYHTSNSKKNYS